MKTINGYNLLAEFTTDNAGFSRWTFAEKNGHTFFVKQFISPKYPLETQELSEKSRNKRLECCDKFVRRKQKLYSALKTIRTGNLVVIEDFFREDSSYYIVTDRISKDGNLDVSMVSALNPESKLLLFRSLLYSMASLHSAGIVHADIKPDNIIVKQTAQGFYTAKIIDFDASYFEGDEPEEILGDQLYFAPESRLMMMGEAERLTTKVDIFALGILFHLYWTGKLPQIAPEYDFVFEAILDNSNVKPDSSLPPELKKLISTMLDKEPSNRPTAKEALSFLTSYTPNNNSRVKGFYRPRIDT